MRALISGAGVAGPTLAWFLAKTGPHVTIVEKSHSLLPIGQNIDVNGTALSVIKKMGLMDELRRLNTTEKGTQFVDTNGRQLASFPLKEGSVSATSEYKILRRDLVKMLAEASLKLPHVEYMFNTTIEKVHSSDGDAVKVELSNGEVYEYDLFQYFSSEDVTVIDKNMYAVYGNITRLSGDNDIRMPCNDAQKKAWDIAARSDRQTQHALIRSEFADADWQAQRLFDMMDQSPDFYFKAIQQIKMSKWSNGRVVCIGDAAYAPTPLTGASLALLGAYVLAGELSKLNPGENPASALKAYETNFRPFVEETQWTAWQRQLFRAAMWVISKIVAVPWFASRHDENKEDANFPLPQ
ncbi:FAD/NAD(P)-binding domain-containing protein [Lentithecium fluviatile CBS 122367]|uniref:FAD/NAD(P)-binding domain-containing protein n=1 Tax=Lentithecium fluviatile CBS 122367 TaxID=1168545 RepID=A0A6G1IRX6_9PLEO|nr:FAD/NAD(P)-binding domain-containing protein [Lentithecium fluviatile CBS 122367]